MPADGDSLLKTPGLSRRSSQNGQPTAMLTTAWTSMALGTRLSSTLGYAMLLRPWIDRTRPERVEMTRHRSRKDTGLLLLLSTVPSPPPVLGLDPGIA